MIKSIMIRYCGKEYSAGVKVICDICTKTIFDSRHQKDVLYYTTKDSDLCCKGCVRKTFDHYLNKELLEGDEFYVAKAKFESAYDYNTQIPKDIPVEEYKRLQREAR